MIYVLPKDFYSNFTSAAAGKDSDSQRDMLISEIGDLIVNNRKDVAEALTTIGAKTDEGESSKKIISKVVNNFSNHKLQIALAYLIANKHGLAVSSSKSGAADPVKMLSNSIGMLAKDIEAKKVTTQQFTESLTQASNAQGEGGSGGSGVYLGLVISLIVK